MEDKEKTQTTDLVKNTAMKKSVRWFTILLVSLAGLILAATLTAYVHHAGEWGGLLILSLLCFLLLITTVSISIMSLYTAFKAKNYFVLIILALSVLFLPVLIPMGNNLLESVWPPAPFGGL